MVLPGQSNWVLVTFWPDDSAAWTVLHTEGCSAALDDGCQLKWHGPQCSVFINKRTVLIRSRQWFRESSLIISTFKTIVRDCPFEGWQVYRVRRKWSYQLWSSEAECACSWTGKKRGLRWDCKKAFKISWLYFYYQKISSNLDAKRVKSHSSNSVNKLLIYWHLLSYFYFSVNNDLALVVSGFIRSVLWLFRKESPT